MLPDDATVEFGEYMEEYNRVGPGASLFLMFVLNCAAE